MARNSHKYSGIDFTGQRHERLTVIRKSNKGRSWWICKCDCGEIVEIPTFKFLQNKSCGCLEKENRKSLHERKRTHGMTETRLYSVWCGIKDRCYNSKTEHFDRYGGRGITMCDEWKHSFELFQEWAYSAGYNDKLSGKEQSIDRIDVNGNYCPQNCRWVNQTRQMRNTAKAVYVLYNGDNIPILDFCELYKITYPHFVKRRIDKGISADRIIREWNFKSGNHEGYYTMHEASAYYSVGEQSIKDWIDKGWIKAEKIGQSWYIPIGQTVKRREDRDEKGRFISKVRK